MEIIDSKQINIEYLVKALKKGMILAMPTETVYGLIADSTNKKAIKNIYMIKGRNFNKSLPLICSSIYQVKKYFFMPTILFRLVKKYWPGSLSIIFVVRNNDIKVPKTNNTLVARVSSDKLLKLLARKLGKPLTATSANISGQGELYSGKEVADSFIKRKIKPDIIIDGGKITKRKPSTIVGLLNRKIKVFRQGDIRL